MAYKILGGVAPSATSNTDVYTVPGGKTTIVSTIAVCNRSASGGTYRIAIRPAGAAIANNHYIVYDAAIGGNATDYHTAGFPMAATDVLTVYCSSANFTVTAYGAES